MEHQDQVLHYPDPRLRRKAEPVEEITPEIQARVRAMFPLMYEERGIGLAAPQLGWNVRLFVVNISGEPGDEFALINPELVEEGGGTWVLEEGCLSLPGIHGKVKRNKRIVMRGYDLDGNEIEIEADGMVARCMLHEFDHLDGILFIDRLSPVKKQSIKRKLRTLE
ncbi:MAG TPA: peptide deformylase, partial [Planctomycetes bacterium]|nr:peptide deformylase [Planctomycetota bacterium]